MNDLERRPGSLRPGPRRVLVTGAGGAVAIELIERLLTDPRVDAVLAVDRDECPRALVGADPQRLDYQSADLGRPRAVDNLFLLERHRERPIDTVVQIAFVGDPLGHVRHPPSFNVAATENLLAAALRHGVGKYVFLSSDAVYRLGPRGDYRVAEDAELELEPGVHPRLRDVIDAEFMCRAKMDHAATEVMVLRPSGVLGSGVVSGLNLLFESEPPLLPIGFDPMVNPITKERLARDLLLAIHRQGKGVYNVAGVTVGPLSRFLEERGIRAVRLPGASLGQAYRVARWLGRSHYHAGFQLPRLFYSLVLDDRRFGALFRGDV